MPVNTENTEKATPKSRATSTTPDNIKEQAEFTIKKTQLLSEEEKIAFLARLEKLDKDENKDQITELEMEVFELSYQKLREEIQKTVNLSVVNFSKDPIHQFSKTNTHQSIMLKTHIPCEGTNPQKHPLILELTKQLACPYAEITPTISTRGTLYVIIKMPTHLIHKLKLKNPEALRTTTEKEIILKAKKPIEALLFTPHLTEEERAAFHHQLAECRTLKELTGLGCKIESTIHHHNFAL